MASTSGTPPGTGRSPSCAWPPGWMRRWLGPGSRWGASGPAPRPRSPIRPVFYGTVNGAMVLNARRSAHLVLQPVHPDAGLIVRLGRTRRSVPASARTGCSTTSPASDTIGGYRRVAIGCGVWRLGGAAPRPAGAIAGHGPAPPGDRPPGWTREPVSYRGLPSRIQHLGARPGRDALAQFGERAPPVARFGGRARRAVHHGDGGPDRIRGNAAVGGGAPAAADRPVRLGP